MTRLWVAGVYVATASPVGPWPLPHGVSPAQALWDNGFVALSVLDAWVPTAGDEIVVSFEVRPSVDADRSPGARQVALDPGLTLGPEEEPVRVQRLAAYAVVTSPRGVLLVQFSEATNAPGRWGPPGGGIEPGETLEATVIREVMEETGQRVRVGRPQAVVDRHWIGRAPGGRVEDFHAVGVLWEAVCDEPSAPVVHEVGGTTARAAWVPADEVPGLPLLETWREVLERAARSASA